MIYHIPRCLCLTFDFVKRQANHVFAVVVRTLHTEYIARDTVATQERLKGSTQLARRRRRLCQRLTEDVLALEALRCTCICQANRTILKESSPLDVAKQLTATSPSGLSKGEATDNRSGSLASVPCRRLRTPIVLVRTSLYLL